MRIQKWLMLGSLLFAASSAQAGLITYSVYIDTSSLITPGTTGWLDFQFNPSSNPGDYAVGVLTLQSLNVGGGLLDNAFPTFYWGRDPLTEGPTDPGNPYGDLSTPGGVVVFDNSEPGYPVLDYSPHVTYGNFISFDVQIAYDSTQNPAVPSTFYFRMLADDADLSSLTTTPDDPLAPQFAPADTELTFWADGKSYMNTSNSNLAAGSHVISFTSDAPSQIPEPASVALTAAALLFVVFHRRRTRA